MLLFNNVYGGVLSSWEAIYKDFCQLHKACGFSSKLFLPPSTGLGMLSDKTWLCGLLCKHCVFDMCKYKSVLYIRIAPIVSPDTLYTWVVGWLEEKKKTTCGQYFDCMCTYFVSETLCLRWFLSNGENTVPQSRPRKVFILKWAWSVLLCVNFTFKHETGD